MGIRAPGFDSSSGGESLSAKKRLEMRQKLHISAKHSASFSGYLDCGIAGAREQASGVDTPFF